MISTFSKVQMYMQLYMNTSESNLLPVTGSAAGVLTWMPNKYRERQQGHVTDLTTIARCLAGFASRSEKMKQRFEQECLRTWHCKGKEKYIDSVLVHSRKSYPQPHCFVEIYREHLPTSSARFTSKAKKTLLQKWHLLAFNEQCHLLEFSFVS